jgi:prephenate dehydratase
MNTGGTIMKIGYLGPKGSYCESALIKSELDGTHIPFNSIGNVMLAVANKEIDKGIVPIENSIEGTVNSCIDLMLSGLEVSIVREIQIPIIHYLFVTKEGLNEPIHTIMSHPQALGQCDKFILKYFKNADIIPTASTSGAAEEVSKIGKPGYAAIANKLAKKTYNLKVLAKNIQTQNNNTTCFIEIVHPDNIKKKKKIKKDKQYKTSIAFSFIDTRSPGELLKILSILSVWDVNMTKIVSRPSKMRLGEYVFLIDIDGHQNEEHIAEALFVMKKKCSLFRILGSYTVVK